MRNDMPPVLSELDVSRETMERLNVYVEMLKKWNPAINLVSKSTISEAWSRHIADSAQLFSLAPSFTEWTDIGSGGGFPGLVVAILATEHQPGAIVSLIEADRRKASFLRNVSRETGVRTDIVVDRIELAESKATEILSARALAPLTKLLEFTVHHRRTDGISLFPKGARHLEEINVAREKWNFDCEIIPSKVDDNSVILKIGKVDYV